MNNSVSVDVDEEDADFSMASLHSEAPYTDRTHGARYSAARGGDMLCRPGSLQAYELEGGWSDDDEADVAELEESAFRTTSETLRASSAMREATWKRMVDMEVKNVRLEISELKGTVGRLGTVLTGFQDQLRDIASQLMSRAEEGDLPDRADGYPHDSGSSKPALENQLRCLPKSPQQSTDMTPEQASGSDEFVRSLLVEPSSSNMKRREE